MMYAVHSLSKNISISGERRAEFQEAVKNDPVLSMVINFITNNSWPKIAQGELKHFYKIKDDLLLSDGLLFKEDKIVVPSKLKEYVLLQLHTGHLGRDKILTKARKNVYWRGMADDIEKYSEACYDCQKFQKSNCKEPMESHRIAYRPWDLISSDIFHYNNHDYLVIVDSYSNWIELAELRSKTIDEVINIFKRVFISWGLPDEIVSDNNPFTSYKFKLFCKQNGIKHNPSSPLYPKGNGLAEKGVAIAKNILKKSHTDDEISFGLLEYKNSKLNGMEYTPAELMMSRHLKTNVPCSTERLKPKYINHKNVKLQIKKKKEKTKHYYDQHSHPLPKVNVNEDVLLQKDKIWVPARVIADFKNNSYLVETENSQKYRRNRVFLKKTIIPFKKKFNSNLLIDDYDLKCDESQCNTNVVVTNVIPISNLDCDNVNNSIEVCNSNNQSLTEDNICNSSSNETLVENDEFFDASDTQTNSDNEQHNYITLKVEGNLNDLNILKIFIPIIFECNLKCKKLKERKKFKGVCMLLHLCCKLVLS